MRTVLIISRYFPPLYDVGGKRAYRFTLHLPDHGWRPIILTGPVPPDYTPDPTPVCLPAEAEVFRDYAPPWWPYWRSGLADGTHAQPIPIRTVPRARRWLDAQVSLPLQRDVLLAPRTAAWARRLARSTPIDLVFATAPPRAVLAQGFAASRAVGAGLCLDMRDPWTLGFPHRGQAAWVRWVEKRAEASLLARADRVVFTSDDALRGYRTRYPTLAPQRFAVIPNCFDPTLRPAPQPRAARPTLIHFGNCYGPRTLEPVLRALAALRHRGIGDDLRLLNLGRVPTSDLELAERLGVRACIEHRPMLPYADALHVLARADLQVLLSYGTEPGYVPAKFFDYLLTGRPILCVAPPSELTRLVDESGHGRCAAPDDVDAIADAIAAAIRPSADVVAARAVDVERFSAPYTTAQLARLFDEIVEARSR